jgi:hypothetical protein
MGIMQKEKKNLLSSCPVPTSVYKQDNTKIDIRQVAQQPRSQLVADLLCANGGCWLEWLNS